MVKSATDAFKNVDLVLFVVDDSKKIGPGDRKIIEDLKRNKNSSYISFKQNRQTRRS